MAGDIPSYDQRMKWFHQARFGMFIHWGLYSILGRGEWVMFQERIKAREYARLAKRFRPKSFDAKALARTAAEAGMKYMVLTTRHHDGFCLFDSKVSDFTAPKTGSRDFVAEYADACRSAGLKVGFYYSLLDWRFPGYFEPTVRKYQKSAEDLVDQAHAQVKELMSNYGKVDVLWYDGGWVAHGKSGVTDIAAFWRATELNAMVRRLQPARGRRKTWTRRSST
jgi:alpha-L-fucosidase